MRDCIIGPLLGVRWWSMASLFQIRKKKPGPTRKLSWLPRVGLYLDIAGYEISYKYAPVMEAVIHILEKGLSPRLIEKISREQLKEIRFPKPNKEKTIETTAVDVK